MKPPESQYRNKKQTGWTDKHVKYMDKLSKYGVNVNQFIRKAFEEKVNRDWKEIKESNNQLTPWK